MGKKKDKTVEIVLRMPKKEVRALQTIANSAGVTLEDTVKVLLVLGLGSEVCYEKTTEEDDIAI